MFSLFPFVRTIKIYSAGEKQKIPFKMMPAPPQKKKILGINLTKEVKDLYAENKKTLIKEG